MAQRLFLVVFFIHVLYLINNAQELPNNLSFIKEIAEDYSHYTHDSITDRYEVYNSTSKMEFFVILTTPYCNDIRAWGGELPFAIIVNPDNTIRQLVILPNNETPSWISSLETIGFFETWNNYELKAAMNKKVDAVSGSTMTTVAVIESMKRRISLYLKDEFAAPKKRLFKRKS
jgi:Na+-translocating ferredoxin:NAD+ oxidoreductase RnfG subunit